MVLGFMEHQTEQKESEEFSIKKRLIELKAIISSVECRMKDFDASRHTLESARENAERLQLSGMVSFLSKEIIHICFKEFKHWLISGDVENAIQAHLSAAILLSSSCKSIDGEDLARIKSKIFASGIPKVWDIGTYHHRQGNAYLLAGSPSYEVAKHWETAIKCYANVQKLHEIGLSIGAQVPENYCEQAQVQISEIISAKSRLRQSA